MFGWLPARPSIFLFVPRFQFSVCPPPIRTHTHLRRSLPVKPDVNQAELEKIEQDPQAFFSQAMLSGAMIDVISDIEDKHAKILEIERCTQYRLSPYVSLTVFESSVATMTLNSQLIFPTFLHLSPCLCVCVLFSFVLHRSRSLHQRALPRSRHFGASATRAPRHDREQCAGDQSRHGEGQGGLGERARVCQERPKGMICSCVNNYAVFLFLLLCYTLHTVCHRSGVLSLISFVSYLFVLHFSTLPVAMLHPRHLSHHSVRRPLSRSAIEGVVVQSMRTEVVHRLKCVAGSICVSVSFALAIFHHHPHLIHPMFGFGL
jgi:hypothetical protein